jgi:hypothetical protein
MGVRAMLRYARLNYLMQTPEETLMPDDPISRPNERDGPDRLSLRLSPEARKTLEELSALRGGVSLAEVVRRALGTELFLVKEQKEGSRILIESPDKTLRQIILR